MKLHVTNSLRMTTKTLIELLNAFDPSSTRPVFLAFEGTPDAPTGAVYRISLTAGTTVNSTRIMLYAKATPKRVRLPRVKPNPPTAVSVEAPKPAKAELVGKAEPTEEVGPVELPNVKVIANHAFYGLCDPSNNPRCEICGEYEDNPVHRTGRVYNHAFYVSPDISPVSSTYNPLARCEICGEYEDSPVHRMNELSVERIAPRDDTTDIF